MYILLLLKVTAVLSSTGPGICRIVHKNILHLRQRFSRPGIFIGCQKVLRPLRMRRKLLRRKTLYHSSGYSRRRHLLILLLLRIFGRIDWPRSRRAVTIQKKYTADGNNADCPDTHRYLLSAQLPLPFPARPQSRFTALLSAPSSRPSCPLSHILSGYRLQFLCSSHRPSCILPVCGSGCSLSSHRLSCILSVCRPGCSLSSHRLSCILPVYGPGCSLSSHRLSCILPVYGPGCSLSSHRLSCILSVCGPGCSLSSHRLSCILSVCRPGCSLSSHRLSHFLPVCLPCGCSLHTLTGTLSLRCLPSLLLIIQQIRISRDVNQFRFIVPL